MISSVDPIATWNSLQHGLVIENMLKLEQNGNSTFSVFDMKRDVRACHGYIEAGVAPIRTYRNQIIHIQVMHYFLKTDTWGRCHEIKDLFSAYVKSGMLDVDAAQVVDSRLHSDYYKNGTLPLEASIIIGNMSALKALLDNGADINKVPCKENAKRKPWSDPYADIYDLISGHVLPPLASTMAIMVQESILRREIELVEFSMQRIIQNAQAEDVTSPIPFAKAHGARRRIGGV